MLMGAEIGMQDIVCLRSFGPAHFVGGKGMADLWVFVAAPLAGGALAGILHRMGVARAF